MQNFNIPSPKNIFNFLKIMLAFLNEVCYYTSRERDPGVAKFGIALEWGSRGRWFESSHSDQIWTESLWTLSIFYTSVSRTSGLLYFKLAARAARRSRRPTAGSNPVTRTKTKKTLSGVFFVFGIQASQMITVFGVVCFGAPAVHCTEVSAAAEPPAGRGACWRSPGTP